MSEKILTIGIVILITGLLSGCINKDATMPVTEIGIVYKIEEDRIVGGTYTDWMDFIYFENGNIYAIYRGSLDLIELNRTGIFTFEKRFYVNGDYTDKYYKLIEVKYKENPGVLE